MTAGRRRRSSRTALGWRERLAEQEQVNAARAVDEGFVAVAADAAAVGGYVYRTRGGPWMVGTYRKRPPRSGIS